MGGEEKKKKKKKKKNLSRNLNTFTCNARNYLSAMLTFFSLSIGVCPFNYNIEDIFSQVEVFLFFFCTDEVREETIQIKNRYFIMFMLSISQCASSTVCDQKLNIRVLSEWVYVVV